MRDEDYPERRDGEPKAEWRARVEAFVAAGGERRGFGCWGCGRLSLMPWCAREQCREEERAFGASLGRRAR
jgi:hypothetical protein